VYQANGELYYFASLGALGFMVYLRPELCETIYDNFGAILGSLNAVALVLCLYLLIKAKLKTDEKDPYLLAEKFPILHEYYRGMELHPRLLGVDVKQLTNCRIGLMLWQWLVIVFFVASYRREGLDLGLLVSAALQSIYLFKFYHWETGYFNTLDITLDRAGYYICWGCLVWVPTLYTFASFYFVAHPTGCGVYGATTIFVLGVASIFYNYQVDRQKELFKTGQVQKIWGKNIETVKASYTMADGKKKETFLLVSGWWGIARKINYTFELLATYLWCSPAGLSSGWPLLKFFFLFVLLLHRIYRDEGKCKDKYGKAWITYCKKVPYRLIPYLY
jgi:7-dehydrocholesterol reductase